MTGLLATNISVRRGAAAIISDVALSCDSGRCVAVIGENGSGKSTLLRALASFEPSASGYVEVLGRGVDLADGPPAPPLWPDITIVLQDLALWPHLSARENVMLPWRQRDADVRASKPEVDQLFRDFELTEFESRGPASLSGGQRQRLALARAFALRPKFLLLDEPSASLDARHSAKLAERISAAKVEGMGTVCVTHNLGFAAKIADSFCFMAGGRVIANGPWADLRATSVADLNAFLDLHTL